MKTAELIRRIEQARERADSLKRAPDVDETSRWVRAYSALDELMLMLVLDLRREDRRPTE